MRKLSVDASTNEVAQGLCSALTDFWPEIVERPSGGYEVVVALGGGDNQFDELLSALERHVTARADGPANVHFDGRSYTLHAKPEPSQTDGRAERPGRLDELAPAHVPRENENP